MIIVRLMGGLGNQMFQYAAGRRLAQVHKVPLCLDLSYFDHQTKFAPFDTHRSYTLCYFNIIEKIASPDDQKRSAYAWKNTISAKIFRLIQRGLPLQFRSVYWQKWHGFDPAVLNLGKHVVLNGYMQSWRYFADIQEIIRKEFTLREPFHPGNQCLADEICSKTSVGVHIRRGDYVYNSTINQVHGLCSLDYFHEAIKFMFQKVSNPHFFIFSDEPEWVKENFKLNYPVTIMMHNGVERDYEDLYLMSRCQHFIIANSSFSWWAAWLSSNNKKIIVAPKKWFASQYDPVDLLPDTWYRI